MNHLALLLERIAVGLERCAASLDQLASQPERYRQEHRERQRKIAFLWERIDDDKRWPGLKQKILTAEGFSDEMVDALVDCADSVAVLHYLFDSKDGLRLKLCRMASNELAAELKRIEQRLV